MAEEDENGGVNTPTPEFVEVQQGPIPQGTASFLEIECKSSGIIRRFSLGSPAAFAVHRINQLLDPGLPLASYIEAVKVGEEPITFGPQTVVVDYGDGWKLQTVVTQGVEGNKDEEEPFKDFPGIVIEPIRDDVQSGTNTGFSLPDPSLQEENRALTSEQASDIESQSLDKPDFTNIFTTDKIFPSRDELINWTREVGRSVGMVVIIKKSEFGSSGRTSRIFFACERFGHRREYKRPSKDTPTRKRTSKRCDCPFLLRGIKLPSDDQWKVKVNCGHHNHPLGRHLQGSSVAGKLTLEEKEVVKHMLKAGIKPKEILKALKDRDERNESTIRTIYNAQAKMRLENALPGIERCEDECLMMDEGESEEKIRICEGLAISRCDEEMNVIPVSCDDGQEMMKMEESNSS